MNLLSSQKEKAQKNGKNAFGLIWIERIPLLQVYFSLFIAKQGTIFEDICYEQVIRFVLPVTLVV